MVLFRLGAASLLSISLAGCGGAPHEVTSLPIASPMPGLNAFYFTRHFDGSYMGKVALESADSPTCPRPHSRVALIGDSQFTFAYTPDIIFTTPVPPDGSIHGTAAMGNGKVDGQIDPDFNLNLTITTPGCQTTLAMHHVLNHYWPP